MISYAVVDRIEEDTYIVCEVELVELEKSHLINDLDKEIKIMDVLKAQAFKCVEENDVLVVEHDGKNINYVFYKDDDEKLRRLG